LKNITEFEFGKYLDKNIPLIKESIKKQVTEDVNSWLLDIREKAQNIGKFATAQTEAEVKQRDELAELRQKDAREYADTVRLAIHLKLHCRLFMTDTTTTIDRCQARESRLVLTTAKFQTRWLRYLDK
jgi:hypothetical protein